MKTTLSVKEFIKDYPSKAKEYLSDLDDSLLHQMFEDYANAKLQEAAEKADKDLQRIVEQDYGNINEFDVQRIKDLILSLQIKQQ